MLLARQVEVHRIEISFCDISCKMRRNAVEIFICLVTLYHGFLKLSRLVV